MSDIDHELMYRCRLGDATAFEELVRRWQGKVARVLSRLAHSQADVEDLSQEVFLRVLKAVPRYRGTEAFSTWLYTIALNVARDAHRRRRWQWMSLGGGEASHNGSPPAEAARRELQQHVEAALRALPSRLREVLVLRHYGELSFAEVARVAGLPEGTVKSRVKAALVRLRKELKSRGVCEQELDE